MQRITAFLLLGVLFSCSNSEQKQIDENTPAELKKQSLFRSIPASQSQLKFQNPLVENKDINVLTYEYLYNGGGVAAGDINNDGLVDLYFTANMRPNALFLNEGNLKFKDLSRSSNTAGKQGWTTGCTMADVNGDGWLDIYVCRSGNLDESARKNLLFINNKDLSFTESAEAYGLDYAGFSTHASFFDFDLDGDLDMYLLNHNIRSPKGFYVSDKKKERDPNSGDQLFRNDNGKFTNITEEAGIISNPIGFGLGVSTADLNEDGWPDIFVTNDYYEQDYYYINQQDGSFKESLTEALSHTSHFSMGTDVADFNNDLRPDLMSLDMMPRDNKRQKLLQGPSNYDKYQMQVDAGFYHQNMRNMLQLNRGDGSFAEIGQLAGVDQTDWSWSVLFADYDNDGYKDISITNGYLRDYTNMDFLKFDYPDLNSQAQKAGKGSADILEVIKSMPQTKLSNYVFRNKGDLSFEEVSEEWGFAEPLASNGMAYADLDNDGDLDLVLNNLNNDASLYENTSQGNYLHVQVQGEQGNAFGLGTKVFCYSGDQNQQFEILQSRGYQSAVPPVAYFGLGENQKIDSLILVFPNGKVLKKENLEANQMLSFRASEAKPARQVLASNASFFSPIKKEGGLNFVHRESNYVDYKNVPLLPHLLSKEGPALAVSDVNKDGLDDVFIGGAAGQSAQLFLQTKAGNFKLHSSAVWQSSLAQEAVKAEFFDANGDGAPDLYLASGSFEFATNDPALQDQLFLNDGKGNFKQAPLPEMLSSSSAIVPFDFDSDGDLDLFIGTRMVQAAFPKTPMSYLLENDGSGVFADVSNTKGKAVQSLGLITTGMAADLNRNGKTELVLGGEYLPIQSFEWTGEGFEQIQYAGLDQESGFWNTLQWVDLDQDGDLDLLAGNKGLNDYVKASNSNPAKYYGGDMDGDGKYDVVCSNYIDGVEYPCASLDELHKQFNRFQKTYNRYSKYADANMDDLLKELKPDIEWEAKNFSSGAFINQANGFEFVPFPAEAQVAPIKDLLVKDFDGDGRLDLLLVGNDLGNRTEFGRLDALQGLILFGLGKGQFEIKLDSQTGLDGLGEVNQLRLVQEKYLILAQNNAPVKLYKWNQND